MAKPINYEFRPLKTITTWAVTLMVLKLLGGAGLVAWQAYAGLSGHAIDPEKMNDAVTVGFDVTSLCYLVILIVSAVVTLIWIYKAARNTRALRPGLTLTPGWAVGWWFVPFASLYKPYEYVRDIWLTSIGPVDGKYRRGAQTIVVWWWTFLIGNVAGTVVDKVAPDNWIAVAVGLGVEMLATVMFLNIVRSVSRNQVAQNTRVAEVF